MKAVVEAAPAALLRSHDRPRLDSYDSGEEFSIDHWIELCNAVDACDLPLHDEGLPSIEKIEEALEEINFRSGARPRRSELRR